MPNIVLKDILIGARQESHRMRHFYLGAEHLFIALLSIKDSLVGNIVQEYGLTPEYVIDTIRRKIGKGNKQRLWAGIPNTPRTDILLSIASDLALENGREEINERDLLIAMIEERDNLPIRVLNALGLTDFYRLTELAQSYAVNAETHRPYIGVDFGPNFDPNFALTKDQLFILRRMFYGYSQIRIDRHLTGGFSTATLLIVTPIHVDQREDAAVVVKIDQVDAILDEAQRYETHVKSKLPPMTARLEDKPVTPETSNLASIKYTLITDYKLPPQSLRDIIHEWDAHQLGEWLKGELFPTFGRNWWKQSRPYRFQVWREYDWMLPPLLTLEYIESTPEVPIKRILTMPLKRSKLTDLEYGDVVAVENFVAQKIYSEHKTLQLAVGLGTDAAKAYKIKIRDIDLSSATYYRGEVVERVVGRIWATRSQQIIHAIRALQPDFDLEAERIPIQGNEFESLPNPILHYENLLEHYVNGSLCTIHGDLHPGNIMIGTNQSAFLIDFAHTRDGHTLFDWATLETSLLSDIIMPNAGESWADARNLLHDMIVLNGDSSQLDSQSALAPITYIRQIVSECLATENQWSEYFTALAFCSLRAIMWETIPIVGRRLMFLTAALAIHELRTRHRPSTETETPSPDETDFTSR